MNSNNHDNNHEVTIAVMGKDDTACPHPCSAKSTCQVLGQGQYLDQNQYY